MTVSIVYVHSLATIYDGSLVKPQQPGFSCPELCGLYSSLGTSLLRTNNSSAAPLSGENALLSLPTLWLPARSTQKKRDIATKLPPPTSPSTTTVYAYSLSSLGIYKGTLSTGVDIQTEDLVIVST